VIFSTKESLYSEECEANLTEFLEVPKDIRSFYMDLHVFRRYDYTCEVIYVGKTDVNFLRIYQNVPVINGKRSRL